MKPKIVILFLLLLIPGIRLRSAVQISDTVLVTETASGESDADVAEAVEEIISTTFDRFSGDSYTYQLGAFRFRSNAEAILKLAKNYIDGNAIMVEEDGLFKVRVTRMPESYTSTTRGGRQPETVPALNSEPPAGESTGDSLLADTAYTATATPSDSVSSYRKLTEVSDLAQEAVNNIIFIKGDSPWLRRITYLGKSMALVNALIITIMISIITMMVLLVFILLNRKRLEKQERLIQYLKEKYQGLIIDYLFGNAQPDDFKPIASDNYRRQVLVDQMIDVSENLKGDDEKKLFTLYKQLGLDRDSVRRARDRRWHKKIKGFRELAFMNIKDANDAIFKALDSKNEILRMEAQIALVRLSDDDHFAFLSDLKRPFSLWEQITLHELIIQHDIPVPSFSKWLGSSNPTVVMFCLRMIREFKQKDAEEGIRALFDHRSIEVKQLAIQVAGDLDMRSTLEPMKKMYKDQEYKVCLEIVRSMGKMPDPSMLGFLKLVLDKEDDVQLQIEATKAIENNGEEGVRALVKLMKSEYKNYNIIVRHVLDRRIY
ncbi:MAG: HEAT repeat domain-containing protein [Bacteroidales bacterium]|jgi:HEAT repeat protein|nr:HEAT repeat domain-containing protein [Bacteroidales bacterium]